ncbi:hypothetical protein M569_14953, partial [Genlisea aurea]
YEFLKIAPNPDGSITRLAPVPEAPPGEAADQLVFSKDVPLNSSKKTYIRLFRPANPPPGTKLPLLIYFHGGGFVFFSAATTFFHESCSRMAAALPAVVASVDYRLAPEHRLPAAYDDAEEALIWAKSQALGPGSDPWMADLADFSRIFLIGSSAGGTIVYHAALRSLDLDLKPLKIVGLILHVVFLGGEERTESELRLIDDAVVPLHSADLIWSLALPEGADRNHHYGHVSLTDELKEKMAKFPACLVRAYTGDPFVDRQKEFAEILEASGVKVVTEIVDGGRHAVELTDAAAARATFQSFAAFV